MKLEHERLDGWARDILLAHGATPEAANATASQLVRANLRGIEPHGVVRLSDYVARIAGGHVLADAMPTWIEGPGFLRFDGHYGLGQHVATAAVDQAVASADRSGIVAASIAHCGHLGALGLYALRAAEQGMIAFICQETRPIIWPQGARRTAIGNNPLAFSAPMGASPPFVFDMASSAASHGKLNAVARNESVVPEGWATGPDGHPTTDPIQALAGGLAPMAGHKGLGLAMMVQCLAGGLTGASRRVDASGADGSSAGDVGAFLFVVNPDLMQGETAFESDMESWLEGYDSAFEDEGRYPGQNAARIEADRRKNGLPIDPETLQSLAILGEKSGVAFPAM